MPDRVVDILPSLRLPCPHATRQATIEDLLSMQLGLGSSEGGPRLVATSKRDLLERLQHLPMVRPFRSGYAYSTDAFTLLGAVVESVTGRSWSDVAAASIWRPLGMVSTDADLVMAKSRPDWATPHIVLPDRTQAITREYEDSVATPAGGMNSTARDMLLWLDALIGQGQVGNVNILRNDLFADMKHGRCSIEAPFDDSLHAGLHLPSDVRIAAKAYGLGFERFSYCGLTAIGHGGHIDGFRAITCYMPELSVGAHVFLNADPPGLHTVMAMTIIDHLLGQPGRDWHAAAPRTTVSCGARQSPGRSSEATIRQSSGRSLNGRYHGCFSDDGAFGPFRVEAADDACLLMRFPARDFLLRPIGAHGFDVYQRRLLGLRAQFRIHFVPGDKPADDAWQSDRGDVFRRIDGPGDGGHGQ